MGTTTVGGGKRQRTTIGVAVAAAGAVAIAPITAVAPWAPGGLSTVERAARLLSDTDSILNVPMNLLLDYLHAPANEIGAMNELADSFFWTGSWWTPSAANLWGEDPGDPGHFMAIMDFLFPYAPQISGLDQPEIDPTLLANGDAGLGQQLAMLAAAELPVSQSCDAVQCSPMVPVEPVTGITELDRLIDFFKVFVGPDQLPMFAHWLQVPLGSLLDGKFAFPDSSAADNPDAAGIADPSAGIGHHGAVPGASSGAVPGSEAQPGFGFPGTHVGPGGENLMPWAGDTFKFDPLEPVAQWLQSLEDPVSSTTVSDTLNALNPITLFGDLFQAVKADVAGYIIDFNPFVEGGPFCPGTCDVASGDHGNVAMVQAIQDIGPKNPLIAEWLRLAQQPPDNTNPYDAGTVGNTNAATVDQAYATIAGLRDGLFTFGPHTEDGITHALGPQWSALLVNSGILTDPSYLSDNWGGVPGPDAGVTPPVVPGEYGGFNPDLVMGDLAEILGVKDLVPAATSNAVDPDVLFSPYSLLYGLLDIGTFGAL